MPGHRVLAKIELLPTTDGGLGAAVQHGNRSLIFVFPDGDDEARYGGVIENPAGEGEPGTRFEAEIWFWTDLAALHAVAGASFALWYSRPVGRGEVLHILPTW